MGDGRVSAGSSPKRYLHRPWIVVFAAVLGAAWFVVGVGRALTARDLGAGAEGLAFAVVGAFVVVGGLLRNPTSANPMYRPPRPRQQASSALRERPMPTSGLSIGQSDRRVETRPCPTCQASDDIVMGIVRRDGRALIDYHVRCHRRRVEAFIDVGLIEYEELGDFDGPDGYCVVFSCWIGNGQVVLIDAPAVGPRDEGWRDNLSRETAVFDDRREEWREILDFLVNAEPVLQQIDLPSA